MRSKTKRRRPAADTSDHVLPLTLTMIVSRQEWAYVVELAGTGLYGADEHEVALTFLRRGLQEAMTHGFLTRP